MRTELSKTKKIIIKVGSSIIDAKDGAIISRVCKDICKLLDDKMEIILVTSGAISQGMKLMGLSERPRDTKKLQSLAAVGQQKLMLMYEKIFSLHNHYTAQVLITHNDINDRVKYLNIKAH